MGEGITAAVSVKSGDVAMTMYIRGRITPDCLEDLRALITQWADECGLVVDRSSTRLKPTKPTKPTKPARGAGTKTPRKRPG